MDQWLIYGAYGYTGRLIAETAVKRGLRPLLAGRSAAKLRPLAEALDVDYLAFDLADAPAALNSRDIRLVLHAAGPFSVTSQPMLSACLQVGAHYLDLTGELTVFENTFAHDAAARERGVVLISGVGFDIVPSDCLIQYVAKQVTDPDRVEVVIGGPGASNGEIGASAGTLKTNLEMLANGFFVRRNGSLIPIDPGAGMKTVRLLDGEHTAVLVPWGDVITTYHATGIPNISAYLTLPAEQAQLLRYGGFVLRRAMRLTWLRRQAAKLIDRFITGPSEQLRQTGRTQLYAKVTNGAGQQAEAWLETDEAYQFTALAAVSAVERVFELKPCGALTPAQAFGADFVLSIGRTIRQDTL